jgi:predicted metalloenzyme YecM
MDTSLLTTYLSQEILHKIPGLKKDHLWFRMESVAKYQHIQSEYLSSGATLISEAMIANRPCCFLKLANDIQWFNYIELQAPREDEEKWTGLEHVEFSVADFDHVVELLHKDPMWWTVYPPKEIMWVMHQKISKNNLEIKFRAKGIED